MQHLIEEKLSEVQIKILTSIHEECYDDYACGYDSLEDWTDLERKELKPLMIDLRNKGFVTYERGLMNDDGETAGSGYLITYKGKSKAHPCDVCGEYAIYGYDGKKECEQHYLKSSLASLIKKTK